MARFFPLFLLMTGSLLGIAQEQPWRFPAAARVIAIGDLHGDLAATKAALNIAGLIDAHEHWSGGTTVAVQTGDQTDRGDDEYEIILLLEKLAEEAQAAGGALHVLNGNHELMNAALDFRYVTPDGFADFQWALENEANDEQLSALPEHQRGRAVAFRPGGPVAKILAGHNTMIQIGDTLFVHGGVLPTHVRFGIGRLNAEIRAWLRGERERPDEVRGEDSPVWSRHYSLDVDEADCRLLDEVLDLLKARRLVVSHTVQEGINEACKKRVWRIDVGMSAHYGGKPAVLEIMGERVRVLNAIGTDHGAIGADHE